MRTINARSSHALRRFPRHCQTTCAQTRGAVRQRGILPWHPPRPAQARPRCMNTTHPIDDEQAQLWNGLAGRAWVDGQESLDRMFQPFEELLVAMVPAGSASRVLDVGCGTGSTTLAPARRPDAPGQFSFADPHRVGRILAQAGWTDIDIQPIDVVCSLPEKELVGY